MSAKLVPTFANRVCHGQRDGSLRRILGFLDRDQCVISVNICFQQHTRLAVVLWDRNTSCSVRTWNARGYTENLTESCSEDCVSVHVYQVTTAQDRRGLPFWYTRTSDDQDRIKESAVWDIPYTITFIRLPLPLERRFFLFTLHNVRSIIHECLSNYVSDEKTRG
jgi:hypothetical protein